MCVMSFQGCVICRTVFGYQVKIILQPGIAEMAEIELDFPQMGTNLRISKISLILDGSRFFSKSTQSVSKFDTDVDYATIFDRDRS